MGNTQLPPRVLARRWANRLIGYGFVDINFYQFRGSNLIKSELKTQTGN